MSRLVTGAQRSAGGNVAERAWRSVASDAVSFRRRRSAARHRPREPERLPASLGGPQPHGAGSDRAGPGGAPDAARIVEILSHELRSPITTIHLGTKVLRGAGDAISGAVRREVVTAVDEEAERLYRLVEDLLAVARHEDGRLRLPTRPLLLQHWLPQVIDAAVHADPALRVRFALAPDLPPVLADDAALAHVVRNLLHNAARHAADGMPVEIVAWPPDRDHLALDVLDRGPGVDPAEAERLFQPFYRAEATATAGPGAGLGLAAARRLARAMDGDVAAMPRDGGGARFSVQLRLARDDEAPDEAHESRDDARSGAGDDRQAIHETPDDDGSPPPGDPCDSGQAVSGSPRSGSSPSSRIAAAAAAAS